MVTAGDGCVEMLLFGGGAKREGLEVDIVKDQRNVDASSWRDSRRV